ncbi:hypothetical protein Ancab_002092 [Ancistrocladus abbreviatus]
MENPLLTNLICLVIVGEGRKEWGGGSSGVGGGSSCGVEGSDRQGSLVRGKVEKESDAWKGKGKGSREKGKGVVGEVGRGRGRGKAGGSWVGKVETGCGGRREKGKEAEGEEGGR